MTARDPGEAWADVRASDEICDYTVEMSGAPATFFPNVDANFATLVNADGQVFFARGAAERTQIASITKIMTAIVALEYGADVDMVTVSEAAASIGESTAGLAAGDQLSFEDALKAMMIPSGNDAALALAENVGAQLDPADFSPTEEQISYGDEQGIDIMAQLNSDDAEQRFVGVMNLKAQEIGCQNTIFTNPHGLDGEGYGDAMHSSPADVTLMGKTAMASPEFREIVDQSSARISVRNSEGQVSDVELESTDLLLGVFEGACGIKTGNTDLAGPCFAGACERNGVRLYAAVLQSSSEEQRFTDTETLFNWYFDNIVEYPLAQSSETVTMTIDGDTRDVPVAARVAHLGWLDRTFAATLADPAETVSVFRMNGNVSQSVEINEINGNVEVGDVVGHITFYQNNRQIAESDLVACEQVPGPNPFESVGIWWERLWRGFSGQSASATSVIMNQTPLIFDKAA